MVPMPPRPQCVHPAQQRCIAYSQGPIATRPRHPESLVYMKVTPGAALCAGLDKCITAGMQRVSLPRIPVPRLFVSAEPWQPVILHCLHSLVFSRT